MADKKKATEEPKADEPKVVETNPNAGKDIDQRMADLLKDHQKMGAR